MGDVRTAASGAGQMVRSFASPAPYGDFRTVVGGVYRKRPAPTSGRSARRDPAEEGNHFEVAGQEVLEHDPLRAHCLKRPDPLPGLVGGAD